MTDETSLCLISGTTCSFILRDLGSVGAGTIISAILVGIILGIIIKLFGERLDKFLNDELEVISYE